MPRSDEAEWWFNAVYEAVQEIPYGKVTSYGHIARLLGKRKYLQKALFQDWDTCSDNVGSAMSKVHDTFIHSIECRPTDVIQASRRVS